MTPDQMRRFEEATPEVQERIIKMHRDWLEASANGLIAGMVFAVVVLVVAMVWP